MDSITMTGPQTSTYDAAGCAGDEQYLGRVAEVTP